MNDLIITSRNEMKLKKEKKKAMQVEKRKKEVLIRTLPFKVHVLKLQFCKY